MGSGAAWLWQGLCGWVHWQRGLLIKKALDKLSPLLGRAVVINDNFRGTSKEKSEIADDDIIIVKVRASWIAFVLAARCQHMAGGSIIGATNDLAKETKLSGRNHVLDCWDVVEHSPIFLFWMCLSLTS